jgi:hypothetical protein
MIWPLRYLRSAEVARGGKPSKVTRFLVVVAPATCAVAGIGATIVETIDAHKFVTQANHTTAAFNALTIGVGPATFVILEDLGFLALVVTFILISLRAQRAGLLPKALGIIGIAAGVLFIIVLVPLPVLQLLWLVGIGMMLLELGGLHRPPAWDAGEAIPWVGRRSVRTVPPPRWRGRDRGALAPVPTPPPAPSRSASQKRKRRRG